jgi:hypothetical protein
MIFYVSADAGRLPAPLLRGGQHGAVLVLPQDLTPAVRCAPSFEVSGCRGYLLAASGRALTARERVA